ncbi:hypothetical protein PENSPDRAFT_653007 [Peniophora sp. CONT]|nr:hypothetical protein PENSPDRAFT_653007 [Peniophora sp. CONT]
MCVQDGSATMQIPCDVRRPGSPVNWNVAHGSAAPLASCPFDVMKTTCISRGKSLRHRTLCMRARRRESPLIKPPDGAQNSCLHALNSAAAVFRGYSDQQRHGDHLPWCYRWGNGIDVPRYYDIGQASVSLLSRIQV